MPSNDTVEQELRMFARALFKGSRLSGSKSFMIKTPEMTALYMMKSNSRRIQTDYDSRTLYWSSWHGEVYVGMTLVSQAMSAGRASKTRASERS